MNAKEYAIGTLSNVKYVVVASFVGAAVCLTASVAVGLFLGAIGINGFDAVAVMSSLIFLLLPYFIGDYAMTYYNVKRIINND